MLEMNFFFEFTDIFNGIAFLMSTGTNLEAFFIPLIPRLYEEWILYSATYSTAKSFDI